MSIHVELQNLAVNTILQVQHIPDLDAALMGLDAPVQETEETEPKQNIVFFNSYDESVLCAKAFRVLKNLVFEISTDSIDFPEQATPIVSQIYRWLTSPQSRLYDPALHNLVQKLLKKVFMQLIAEMKRLGARLVYASFSKIIIATNKHSYKDAKEYFKFIKKTIIQKRELFHYLQMEPVNYWEVLLFKDLQNYVAYDVTAQADGEFLGIVDGDAEGFDERSGSEVEAEADRTDKALQFHVLLASYFPEAVSTALSYELVRLVADLQRAKKQVLKTLTPAEQAAASAEESRLKAADGQLGAMTAEERQDDVVSDLIAEWHRGEQSSESIGVGSLTGVLQRVADAEKLVLQDLAAHVFDTCQDLKQDVLASREEFAAHASSLEHLVVPEFSVDNPALEFIKVCCYMVSLKKSFSAPIQALKRNLLRDVNVREFAPEAQFVDPGHSYIIPNIARLIQSVCCR